MAGGVALNLLTGGRRLSRDLDLFHDTTAALREGCAADIAALQANGCDVSVLRDSPAYCEAVITRDGESTVIQWTRDSAFRFFPLEENELLGLTLHPFDLATNKVLALAGRREVRDWVDLLSCIREVQPLGYLVWAACGKDPGYSPGAVLSEVRRVTHVQEELDDLAFEGDPPRADVLAREWHVALSEAEHTTEMLPAAEVGACVLENDGRLCARTAGELEDAVRRETLRFHRGSIKGVFPDFPGQA